MLVTSFADPAARTYTESEVADMLGLPRSTLNFQRRKGYLNLGLDVRPVSPGRRAAVRYDADFVDAILAESQPLYREEAVIVPQRGPTGTDQPGQDEPPTTDEV